MWHCIEQNLLNVNITNLEKLRAKIYKWDVVTKSEHASLLE